MEKPYSEIVGLPLLVDGMGKAGRITDVLIDTTDGRVASFFVSTGKMQIISPMDIVFFGQAVVISDFEDIIDPDELIKAKKVIEADIGILKSRVVTKKGAYLGRLFDYFIDTSFYGLTKIVVYKSYFGLFRTPERIIPAKDIIEIKKGLIVVKNEWATKFAEQKDEEPLKGFYPDLAS